MSVNIMIPTPLRSFVGGHTEVNAEGTTVGEALSDLTLRFADLKKHLYTDDGRLRSFINVYLGDEDIRHLGGRDTPVKNGDTLMIVPSIAGGSSTAEAR